MSLSSSSIYLKQGKTFKITDKEALDIHDILPVGTYTVGFNCASGEYFLETIDSFDITGKLYGETNRHATRILSTFEDRTQSTGVLLTGEKGSGKTLLAKRISMLAAQQNGIPTIVVNHPWCGEQFNQFMQRIQQPAVIVFDEFEKVYAQSDKQAMMLTLLDGVYPSKKLFLLTCNNKWSLNVNMRNRPGRIFYMLDYTGLSEDFIREYCQDNLIAKDHIPNVCAISKIFAAFNFDMLKAMVEEMNRYKETASQVLEFLNARPQFDAPRKYTMKLYENGVKVDMKHCQTTFSGNPLKDEINVYYKERTEHIKFSGDDLERVEESTGAYIFVKVKKGFQLSLKPQVLGSTMVNFAALESAMKLSGPKKPALKGSMMEDPLVEGVAMEDTDSESDSGDY